MRHMMIAGLTLLAACNEVAKNQLADEDEVLATTSTTTPPPPTDSIPGTLGGPCGVNYAECKTSEQLVQKFRTLKKSAFKETCRVIEEEELMTFELEMDAPRLVNDHSGTKDRLKIVVREFGTFARSEPFSQFEYFRNGAQVVRAVTIKSGTNQDAGVSVESVDVMKGGYETALTLLDSTVFTRLNSKSAECRGARISGNPQCIGCFAFKGLVIGGIAATSIGVGSLVGIGLKALIGGTAAVASFLTASEVVYSCGDWCKRGECMEKATMCRNNCPPPPRCDPCGPDRCLPCTGDVCKERCEEEARSCCGGITICG